MPREGQDVKHGLKYPAVPILTVGFGILISLMVLAGIGGMRQSESLYRDFGVVNDRYRQAQHALDDLAKCIYVIGLLARDDLMDRSNSATAQYRAQAAEERSLMENSFARLDRATEGRDHSQHARLRNEVEAYWRAVQPIFGWTTKQKAERSPEFLAKEILPRREAALSIAREVSDLMRSSLSSERLELDSRHSSFMRYLRNMLGGAVAIGIVVAAIAILMTVRLERKSREEHSRTEAAEQQLRLLSQQLVRAQEDERKSISRELHDEVGQMLTALRMELRSVQELRTGTEEQFIEHVDSAKRLTEQSLRSLKDLAMGLRPAMLDDLGLGSAVQWQGRQFSKLCGVPVNIQLSGLDEPLPDRQRTCAYRLVQEALTNCGRHAKASAINVSIRKAGGTLSVSVKDDGVGFDTAKTRRRGLGLLGMEERVKALGGELSIVSQPRAGTSVHATIPLAPEEGSPRGDSDSISG